MATLLIRTSQGRHSVTLTGTFGNTVKAIEISDRDLNRVIQGLKGAEEFLNSNFQEYWFDV